MSKYSDTGGRERKKSGVEDTHILYFYPEKKKENYEVKGAKIELAIIFGEGGKRGGVRD